MYGEQTDQIPRKKKEAYCSWCYPTLETTQGQICLFKSQLPFKCCLLELDPAQEEGGLLLLVRPHTPHSKPV